MILRVRRNFFEITTFPNKSWVQKPMPFPPKSTEKKDDEEFERFAEMLRPVCLRTRLTDILKMAPLC